MSEDIFFSERIVEYWNMLPDDVVSAATTSSFTNRLDTWHLKLAA